MSIIPCWCLLYPADVCHNLLMSILPCWCLLYPVLFFYTLLLPIIPSWCQLYPVDVYYTMLMLVIPCCCAQADYLPYWAASEGESKRYGPFDVTAKHVDKQPDYVKTVLSLSDTVSRVGTRVFQFVVRHFRYMCCCGCAHLFSCFSFCLLFSNIIHVTTIITLWTKSNAAQVLNYT